MSQLFVRAGWYPLKTDAGLIRRGSGTSGSLPPGWPDRVFFRRLPGTTLCVAALVELKTRTGRTRLAQTQLHQRLRQQYGLHVQVARTPEAALSIIQEGARVARLLKGSHNEQTN